LGEEIEERKRVSGSIWKRTGEMSTSRKPGGSQPGGTGTKGFSEKILPKSQDKKKKRPVRGWGKKIKVY